MPAILTILPILEQALSVVGSFSGNAKVAKVTGYVQDAASVIGALTPLVQQFTQGKEVTEDDVRVALAGMDKALSEFDAAIKAKGG